MQFNISVIIPSRGRAAKLAACVRSLRAQDLTLLPPMGKPVPGVPTSPALPIDRYEVIVTLDGPDQHASDAARSAWGADEPGRALRVIAGPQAGQATARNRALDAARGSLALFLNDDVVAHPQLLASHAERQARARTQYTDGVIIVGDTPWRTHPNDSLFDRLVRDTSMIFFSHHMHAEHPTHPEKDWGYRHCVTINASIPTAAARAVGAFAVFPTTYGYEDVEIAWRLKQALGMPVLFEPAAVVVHDHRYSPSEYLARERALGITAWGFAGQTPDCARHLFGRDIRSAAEIAYSREFVARERVAADRLRGTLEQYSRIPADAIQGPHAKELLNALYEQHLLLKRWEWRVGLLEALDHDQALAMTSFRSHASADTPLPACGAPSSYLPSGRCLGPLPANVATDPSLSL